MKSQILYAICLKNTDEDSSPLCACGGRLKMPQVAACYWDKEECQKKVDEMNKGELDEYCVVEAMLVFKLQ